MLVSSTNTKRATSSSCMASTNKRRNATTRFVSRSAAWTLFLRPQPRRSTACHTAVRCNDGPPAATKACPISASVASGRARRQVSRHWSPAASRRGAGPGWRGNSATEPLVRWRRNSLSVNDNETEKRAATWYILAPGSAHAAATRSRKAWEYAFMSECTAELRTLTPNLL